MYFNHLNYPAAWRAEYSKYPEGLSILESLMQWIRQVDDMVDSHNANQTTINGFGDRLDSFVAQYGEHLQETITETLSEWQASGFLDVVIDAALQTEMDNLATTTEQALVSFSQELAQIHTNVKDFGAVGDGVTDDRLAIQNAIDSLNGTGGTIYFPPTPNFYALKSKHPIHSTYLYIDQPGITFTTGSQGIVSSTLKPTIKAVGVSLDSVILMSNKAWHIKMDGIYVHGGDNRCVTGIKSDGWITRCEFNHVKVTQVSFACFDIRGYLLSFNHCISAYSGNKGFYIHGLLGSNVEGTTTVLNVCFAMNCTGIGYHLSLMTYSSINNSGADGCGVGYFLEQTNNVSLNTNGSERTVEPIHLRQANYTTIDGFTVYGTTTPATTKIKGVIQTIQTGSWYVNIANIAVQSGLIGPYFDYLLYIHTDTASNFVILDKTVRKTVIYDLSSDGVTFPLYVVKKSGANYVDGWSGTVQSTLDSFGRVTIVGRVTVGNTTKGTIASLDSDVKPKIVTTFSGYDVSGGSVNRAVHGFYVSDTGNLGFNGVPSDLSIGRDIHINTSYII